ncbi:MAG: IS200/IS605 family transposase [Phycisphaerales bacterium]|nr:IS200/IS605 family transposase [Phycisphaerales bacterium]
MAQSLSQLYVHVVWSTKGRAPLVPWQVRPELAKILHVEFEKMDCCALAVACLADHVHVLFRQPRTRTAADIVMRVKVNSSIWVKDKADSLSGFRWQRGYGIFSVSASMVPTVRAYVENQEAHHRAMSFEDEYRATLMRHDVEFDERYVWD